MSASAPAGGVGVREAVSALFQGIRLCVGDRAMRRRVAASLAVNAAAFLALVTGLVWGAFALVELLVGGAPPAADAGWLEEAWWWLREGLGWLLRIAAVLGALFIAPVLFSLLASILLPMFHGPVFTAARRRAGGPPISEGPGALRATAGVVATEVRRLVRFLGLSALLLPLNLVPAVGNVAYVAAQLALSAHTLGWDLLSHHFELHGLPYARQKAWLRAERGMVLAFGAVATALCTIPVAQLLFVTTNVAGAGILSARLDGGPGSPGEVPHGPGPEDSGVPGGSPSRRSERQS